MEKTADIPEGVEVKLEGKELIVSGPRGELRRKVGASPVKIEISGNTAKVTSESDRRRVKSHAGTWASHIRNMITGVTQGWEARLKLVYSHFPMKFTVEGDTVTIANFLGERKDRKATVKGDVKVELRKDVVIVTGNDREEVGQAAARIELLAKVRGYDRRVFQDGIHLMQKTSPIEEDKGE
jgi:large subunit ribosomal protein L6